MLADLYARHERVALMYSGGRDSMACLELVRPWLERTWLVWVNTQANFPEIEAHMAEVRSTVPHFHEVRTDQPTSIREKGYPADVVPVNFTPLGQACTELKPIRIRSYIDCCAENFMLPADAAARALGCTAIIRGQRNSESHRGPIASGTVSNGVEYVFPIADWSALAVIELLEENGVQLSERLMMPHSSLDCWNCTAYAASSLRRMRYIKRNHPERYEEVRSLMTRVQRAARDELDAAGQVLEI